MVNQVPLPLPGIPPTVLEALQRQVEIQGSKRLALVGGAVRDALLHNRHQDPWRSLPDLDLVTEGLSEQLALGLRERLGLERVPELRVHGCFGTVELILDGVKLDLAQARKEYYPAPGENPVIEPGPLMSDLARRDFTVNAMALVLPEGDGEPELLDPHGGQVDLAARQLNFLHEGSVADDPTRVFRGARYAARLNFELAVPALVQLQRTIAEWPWHWRPGHEPIAVPPALGTRLRMELELLFLREPWREAITHLQAWQALPLLDQQLQNDDLLKRHLHRAERLGLPLLLVLVAASANPLDLAQRLQLPQQQQRWLEQRIDFKTWLANEMQQKRWQDWDPAQWSEALEARHWSPEVVALTVAFAEPYWRPVLRWWGRWRHVSPAQSARTLMDQGMQPGPQLGEALRQSRFQRLKSMR